MTGHRTKGLLGVFLMGLALAYGAYWLLASFVEYLEGLP